VEQFGLGASGSRTALYVSNFWFLGRAVDYFAPNIGPNPFLHTWSLAVEEQFYLVWPAIVLLGLRGRHPRRTLCGAMILIAAGSLAVCVWFTRINQPWAFFSPSARAWEFAAGGIAFLLSRYELRVPRMLRAFASWLGIAAMVATAALLRGEVDFPGWRALIPVLGTVAVLNGRVPDIGAARFLELPFLQWLGRLSYSWYLWHWPVLALARDVNPALSFSGRVLCVTGSLIPAAVTHVLIENPIRFNSYLALRPVLSLSLAGLVTMGVAGASILWQQSASRASRSLDLARASDGTEGTNPCHISFASTKLEECVRGSPTSSTTLVLFGDSHANQWEPALETIANDRGWRLVMMAKPACPTARVTIFSLNLKRIYTECDTWREAALKQILEIRPAAVVIANRQMQEISPKPKDWNSAWRDGSRQTLEPLNSAGITTIILRDTPAPGFDVPSCIAGNVSWWARKRASRRNPCMLNRAVAVNDGVFRAEQESAAGLRHVSLLDLTDLFCDGAVCPPSKNGIMAYSDDSHISGRFSRSLAPALASRLIPLIASVSR
jgi:peptidoglycan/LPS O-acetylase OafA/YrhL